MNDTPNLALPYILAAQAQKHVTHNEAIRALDCLVQLAVESRTLTAPPSDPVNGARYVVAESPMGAWSGNADKIAAFQDGAWTFYAPKEGWAAWVAAESALIIYAAGSWSLFAGPGGEGGGGRLFAPVGNSNLANMANGTLKGRKSSGSGAPEDLTGAEATALLDTFAGSGASHKKGLVPTPGATAGTARYLREDGSWSDVSNVPLVGVNTTADATNKFAVKSAATLFDNAGNGHQQKINKAAASDTASQLYQTNYSGRAELGLTGDDDFHFKVSPDGTAWREAIKIDRNTGKVSFPQSGGPREVLTADRTYYVRSDGSDSNTGLANNSGGAFVTPQAAIDALLKLDLSGFTVTISVQPGTYTSGFNFAAQWIGGNVVIDLASGAVLSLSAGSALAISAVGGSVLLKGAGKLQNSGGPCIRVTCPCLFTYGGIEFGACSDIHIRLEASGINAVVNANYSISGSAGAHLGVINPAYFQMVGRTITISGTPAFSPFLSMDMGATARITGNTFSGSATGSQYSCNRNSTLRIDGATLPGNSTGSAVNGGIAV